MVAVALAEILRDPLELEVEVELEAVLETRRKIRYQTVDAQDHASGGGAQDLEERSALHRCGLHSSWAVPGICN